MRSSGEGSVAPSRWRACSRRSPSARRWRRPRRRTSAARPRCWLAFRTAAAMKHADEVMELLGLTRVAGILSRNLSHGDQKLLDIGLALALEPKVAAARRADGGHGAGRALADDRDGAAPVARPRHDPDLHRARHGYRLQGRPDGARPVLRRGAGRRHAGGGPAQSAGHRGLSRQVGARCGRRAAA